MDEDRIQELELELEEAEEAGDEDRAEELAFEIDQLCNGATS